MNDTIDAIDMIDRTAIQIAGADAGKRTGARADTDARRRGTLERIAQLIGRPVESLIDGLPTGDEIGDAAELIGLWYAIRGADDRRRLLALTRELAEG